MKDTLIIVDSCCEIPESYTKYVPIEKVPFHVIVGNNDYLDDGTIDCDELLKKMEESPNAARSACPSPQDYINVFEKYPNVKNIFIVSLSSSLSGAYNSAVMAVNMYKEDHNDIFCYVFDSQGASATEMEVVMKINEYVNENENYDNNILVSDINKYISNLNTYFMLQHYDNFVKSGRINKAIALIGNMLNIIPIMKGEGGVIVSGGKARGINKGIQKLVDAMKENVSDFSIRTLSITHCKAENLVNMMLELIKENNINFRNIIINKTDGLSTMYAEEGGIIISY